ASKAAARFVGHAFALIEADLETANDDLLPLGKGLGRVYLDRRLLAQSQEAAFALLSTHHAIFFRDGTRGQGYRNDHEKNTQCTVDHDSPSTMKCHPSMRKARTLLGSSSGECDNNDN